MFVNNMPNPKRPTDKSKVLIGVVAFALLVVVIVLIVKRPREVILAEPTEEECAMDSTPDDFEALPPMTASPMTAVPAPPPPVAVAVEPTAPPAPEPLPPTPAAQDASSAQTVESHRAELMRGSSVSRARVSAPTTSALIMNSALTGRENDSSRQNIGATAMMDRMMPSSSRESVPW